jgi:hypothetical protein
MATQVAALTHATSYTTIGACIGIYLQYARGCANWLTIFPELVNLDILGFLLSLNLLS